MTAHPDQGCWEEQFRSVYDRAVDRYRSSRADVAACFDDPARAFLASIGHRPQEIYHFVEDWCGSEEPDRTTVVEIARVRREYFLEVQGGQWSEQRIRTSDLPAKNAALAGYRWLPRIIGKARAKLRGELPDDLMYCCGGDRAFLGKIGLDPATFLRMIWATGDDTDRIVKSLRSSG